ncbi:cGMP-dependent protein kinase 1-like isoform X2 [Oncorhynchus tshawytscha]|uniref:cGMP-dependent protein kinase n=1 Tax=Oncorhynchus tshawytscha TaxID=74940 RepID=A0AAZ3PQV2_ONCTS|nr:cGMP-dependent protein kinase 1-like isoform X2 [Oncorhynchus tshawytscha]
MGTLRDLQFALQLKIEELRQRDTLIDELELELDAKDDLIRRLQGELDRYRATITPPESSGAIEGHSAQCEEIQRTRRKTILSKPLTQDPRQRALATLKSYNKSQQSQELIQTSFLENDFLKNLESGQILAIMDCMYPTTVNQGCCVIQEGDSGTLAYVLEEGKMEMTKDAKKLLTIEPGKVFGELALLYSCTYTYTISALKHSMLWVIDRQSFQTIMVQSGLSRLAEFRELLCRVPFLRSLPEDVLMKVSDILEESRYSEGDYIIRQGATGDTFYIISSGQVKVTENKSADEEAVLLSTLSEGHWFGEKALRGEDVRTVNVIAAGDVTCLVVDRESFKKIIGLVEDSHNVHKSSELKAQSEEDSALLSNASLRDFQVICNLGEGETGHSELVQLKTNVNCPFTMRVLRKHQILSTAQQECILRERHILMAAHSPFIVRLHRTFRDAKCLYMLTEACLGGELWNLLKDRGSFDDSSTRFYTACVVEALIFLHHNNITYRDLKPENVVLDQRGYAKVVGFGCAKKVGLGKKTWTFCGTPDYVAPEIILNKGHSVSADLWSLGVFVFELLSGSLPFCGPDPMKTFTATIRGIDLVEFPKTISKSASSLIKKLCRNNPAERLGNQRNGAKDIQKHKWFEGFNWEGLRKGTLSSPIIPKFISHLEDSKLDPFTDILEDSPAVENSDWDIDF